MFSAAHRGHLARRAAGVPARVPPLVRLRRHRRRRSWPRSARSWCCRRCSPCSGRGSNKWAVFHRSATPARRRGRLAPHRHDGDAPAAAASPPPSIVAPAAPRRRRSCTSPSACPTTGCCRPATRPAPVQDALRDDFTLAGGAAARGRAPEHGRPGRAAADDRRLRRRAVAARPAWPGSTPLTGSYVGGDQVAAGRARPSARFAAADATWLVGRAVGRADVAAGRAARPRRPRRRRPGRPVGRRAVGRARRLQGVALRRLPLAAGDHRGRHLRRAVPAVRQPAGADQGASSSTCSA